MYNSKKSVKNNFVKNLTDIYDSRYGKAVTNLGRTFSMQSTPAGNSAGNAGTDGSVSSIRVSSASTALSGDVVFSEGKGISLAQSSTGISVANTGVTKVYGLTGDVSFTSSDKSVTFSVGASAINMKAAGGGGGAHKIFSTTHSDTAAAEIGKETLGDLITYSDVDKEWHMLTQGYVAVTNQYPLLAGASGIKTPQYGQLDVTKAITGVTPIANGGTGSATQNFVDLTTDQTVKGRKSFQDADGILISNEEKQFSIPIVFSDVSYGECARIAAFVAVNAGGMHFTTPVSVGGASVSQGSYIFYTAGDEVLRIGTDLCIFSTRVQGSTPTADADLATKKYVDDYVSPKLAINEWHYHVSLTSSKNNLLSNQVGVEGSTNINKYPDVPRTIYVSMLSNNNPTYAGTLSFAGIDCNGDTVNYTRSVSIPRSGASVFTIPYGLTKIGTVKITTTAGAANQTIINAGWYDGLGVGNYPFSSSSNLIFAKQLGVPATTFTLDATYGTITPSTTVTSGDINTFIVKSG